MAKANVFTDIHTLDQEGLKRYAKFAIATGTNQMIFGPAGVGKTQMCIQSAEELGYDVVYLNLSVLEAHDLLGLPMIEESTASSTYALPKQFPRAPARDAKGNFIREKGPDGKITRGKVLVVDEIDKAKPELQNPMLELFQFRSINGTELDFHAVLATGNRPDEGAFSLPVSKALTNRCKVYQLDPKFDPWQEWAADVGLNGLIVGFLSRNQDLFLKPNTSGDNTAYCSPSPRAWSLAGRDLDSAHDMGIDDYVMLQNIIAGYVGNAAATKFQVWLEHYKEIYPMIDALVQRGKHPDGTKTMDKLIVTAIAAGQEIAKLCETDSPSSDDIKKVRKVVDNVSGWMKLQSPDVQIAAMKSTLNMKKISTFKMTDSNDFMEVFKKINKAFKQQ